MVHADGGLLGTFATIHGADLGGGLILFPRYGEATLTLMITTADDADGDLIPDGADNCTLVVNPDQTDTDGDSFGNVCDGDFNNNDMVDFADYGYFRSVFGTADALADFNGNGIVDFADYGRFRAMFGQPPGPAAP